MSSKDIEIRFAVPEDVPVVMNLIRELAKFEKLEHEVVGTKQELHDSMFKDKPDCEVILALNESKPIGFALFFHNYSTFLSRRGLYLEMV